MLPDSDDPPEERIPQLLADWANRDPDARERLVPIVYEELRRLAHHYMRGERQGHTLQTTALVNEVYLRLAGIDAMRWRGRVHFFAMAASLMRRVLVDYARQRAVRSAVPASRSLRWTRTRRRPNWQSTSLRSMRRSSGSQPSTRSRHA